MKKWLERRQLHPVLRSQDEVVDAGYFDAMTQTEQLIGSSMTRRKPVAAVTIRTRRRLSHSSPTTEHQRTVTTAKTAHTSPPRELLAVASAETALTVPHVLDINS